MSDIEDTKEEPQVENEVASDKEGDKVEGNDTGIELTEREIAIAEGNDPEALPEYTPHIPGEEEEDGGSEASESDPGEELPETDEADEADASPGDWVNDTVREVAHSYGMSDEELNSFHSLDEFERAGRLLDRRQPQEKEPEEEPTFTAKQWQEWQEAQEKAEEESKKPDLLDVDKYKAEGYDDDTIKLVEAINEERERNNKLETYLQQQHQDQQQRREAEEQRAIQEEINSFHAAVDSYRPDYFGQAIQEDGTTPPLSQEHTDRRAKLYGEAARIAQNIQLSGGQVPSYEALVRRAGASAFSEEFAREKQEQHVSKVARQSKRRRPVASTAGATPTPRRPKPLTDEEIIHDPDIVKFWNETQQENGA